MFSNLNTQITECKKCQRLLEYCQRVAVDKRRAFQEEEYWGKPVCGWGDPKARILILGLAPAAHGANRTGRMFTGDRSGDFLFDALYRYGFSTKPISCNRNDGVELVNTYISNIVRCAPPENKPTPQEMARCLPYLQTEIQYLTNLKVIISLGRLAYNQAIKILLETNWLSVEDTMKIQFGHGQQICTPKIALITSYHPSQRNTSTGLLTKDMFYSIFDKVEQVLSY